MVFPVVMYGCESWIVKKAERRRIDAFELWCWRRLLSPLDCKEIQPVHSEGDQPWDFFGRNDAKAETPVLWPSPAKSWLIGKDSDAGRDWGQEEKRTTEDEMTGWHHWHDGHESGWTLGVGDGQGGLVCCDSWGSQRVGHDCTTELIWSDLMADSYWGLRANSKILWSNYPSIKNKLIKKKNQFSINFLFYCFKMYLWITHFEHIPSTNKLCCQRHQKGEI